MKGIKDRYNGMRKSNSTSTSVFKENLGTLPKPVDMSKPQGFFEPFNRTQFDVPNKPKDVPQETSKPLGKQQSKVDNKQIYLDDERKRATEVRKKVIAGNENARFIFPSGKNKSWKDMTWKEQAYISGRNLGNIPILGTLSEGVGTMAYESDEKGSIMPYLRGLGAPLIAGLTSRALIGKTKIYPNPKALPKAAPKLLPKPKPQTGWTTNSGLRSNKTGGKI